MNPKIDIEFRKQEAKDNINPRYNTQFALGLKVDTHINIMLTEVLQAPTTPDKRHPKRS